MAISRRNRLPQRGRCAGGAAQIGTRAPEIPCSGDSSVNMTLCSTRRPAIGQRSGADVRITKGPMKRMTTTIALIQRVPLPLMRSAFWLAMIFAVTMALLPKPPGLPIDALGDKFEHMLAFGVMAALAGLSFPQMPLPRIAERLSFLGAMIEVAQSIPALHRDCDIRDWIADTLAIGLILLAGHLCGVFRRRRG